MKHAYLIMAHNNFEILKRQLSLLDYPENDIFIHMDQKAGDFDREQFLSVLKYSRLFFIPRKSLYWADYSQCDVSLDLIEYALKTDSYGYFHILSGVDMPIKTQKYIHDFLEESDSLLLAIVPETMKYCDDRVKYYYSFLDRQAYRKSKLLRGFNVISAKLQGLVGVNRLRKTDMKIYNGWDWLSFPQDYAAYLVERRSEIYDIFHKTLSPIEMFYQTYAYNLNQFKDRIRDLDDLKNSSLRYIDWKRGAPYTFTSAEYDEIMNSNCFFCRKFDEKKDFKIVERIYKTVKQKQDEELKAGI